MIMVLEPRMLVSRLTFIANSVLDLTVYKLFMLSRSLLPMWRHETAVSINRLPILKRHHLLPVQSSISDWNFGVFTETFRCTTHLGLTHIFLYRLRLENDLNRLHGSLQA